MYNPLINKYFSNDTYNVSSALELNQIFKDFNIHKFIDENRDSPENIKYDNIYEFLLNVTLKYNLVDDAIDFAVFESEHSKPKFCILGQLQSLYILNIRFSKSMTIAFFNAVSHYLMPNARELECIQSTALIDSIEEVVSLKESVFSSHRSMTEDNTHKTTLSYVKNSRVRIFELEENHSGIVSRLYELQDPSSLTGGIANGVGTNLVKTSTFNNYYIESAIVLNSMLRKLFALVRAL